MHNGRPMSNIGILRCDLIMTGAFCAFIDYLKTLNLNVNLLHANFV